MPLVLDPSNANKLVNRTDVLREIPNNVGITNALGIFTDVYQSQKMIQITRTTGQNHLLGDRNWDERNQTVAGRERSYLPLRIPHFPADDAITPNDIDGVVQADSVSDAINLETVNNVRAEKMITLREAHALTLETARMQLITQGTVYAPNGTLRTSYGDTVNFYTEFGVTRTEIPVALAADADPREAVSGILQAARQGVRNTSGGVRRFIALCSTEFFNSLWTNAFVTDAVKYFQQPQSTQILTGEPNGFSGLGATFRTLELWGITWVDAGDAGYDDPVTGEFVPHIPAGDAYVIPQGVRGMFQTYYAPANRFATVNRSAQGSYWFEYANQKDDIIEIMTEQNFLNAVLYPQAIIRLFLDV